MNMVILSDRVTAARLLCSTRSGFDTTSRPGSEKHVAATETMEKCLRLQWSRSPQTRACTALPCSWPVLNSYGSYRPRSLNARWAS